MNVFYPTILDQRQCNHIAKGMFSQLENDKLIVENNPFVEGTLAFYNLKETLDFVPYIDKIIRKDYGTKIAFENTYTRIYKNGQDLKIHTDRTGLDISLSICVYSNLDTLWPIFISKLAIEHDWRSGLPEEAFKSSAESFTTSIGAGIACVGKKFPHWRDPLVCNNDQMVIQSFFHWKILK